MLCQAYLALKSAIVDHAQPLVTSLIEDFGNLTNAAGKAHLKAMREAFLKYGKDLDPAVPFLHAAAGVSWWIDTGISPGQAVRSMVSTCPTTTDDSPTTTALTS